MWVIDVEFEMDGVWGHEIVATVCCGLKAYGRAQDVFWERAEELGARKLTVINPCVSIIESPRIIRYVPIVKGCDCT